jgi:hypothetical protein
MSITTKTNEGSGNVWKGAAAGLVGGLVASWTMNRFQDVWLKLSTHNQSTGVQSSEQSSGLKDKQPATGN